MPPHPYFGAKILLFQLHGSFVSDGEVPAKNKFSDPSGVNVRVDEVVPEIPGHTEQQTEKADDQTGSDREDVGQLHVVRGATDPVPDCGIGVKAIVHHGVCKITLKGRDHRPEVR